MSSDERGERGRPKVVDRGLYVQDTKLIDSVRPKEPLYSIGVGCRDFQMREEINQLWNQVAKDSNMSAAQCKARFAQLRNSYRIKMTLFQTTGRELHTKWPYYKQMAFLDPYIQQHRRNKSSGPIKKPLPSRKRDRPRKLNDYISNEYISQLELAERDRNKHKLKHLKYAAEVEVEGSEESSNEGSDNEDMSEENELQISEDVEVEEEEGDNWRSKRREDDSNSEDNVSVNGDNTVIIVYEDTFVDEEEVVDSEEEEGVGEEEEEVDEEEEEEEEGEEREEADGESGDDTRSRNSAESNSEKSSPVVTPEPPLKKRRGRPRLLDKLTPRTPVTPTAHQSGAKRKPGRPRKYNLNGEAVAKPPKPPLIVNGVVVKRKRGRPRRETRETYSPSRNPIKNSAGYSFPQADGDSLSSDDKKSLLVTVTDMRSVNKVFCRRITVEEASKLNLEGFDVKTFLVGSDYMIKREPSDWKDEEQESTVIQEVPVIEESRPVDEVPVIEESTGMKGEERIGGEEGDGTEDPAAVQQVVEESEVVEETVELSEVPAEHTSISRSIDTVSHQLTEEEITQGFTCQEFISDQLTELG